MTTMYTVTISIGTGIGRGARKGQQQTAAQFDQFVQQVRTVLEDFGAEIYVDAARAFGTDEKGAPEGSATFVAGLPADEVLLGSLRKDLYYTAQIHHQRCIAVTVGQTDFVGPGEEGVSA
jgi:hypothetical protein